MKIWLEMRTAFPEQKSSSRPVYGTLWKLAELEGICGEEPLGHCRQLCVFRHKTVRLTPQRDPALFLHPPSLDSAWKECSLVQRKNVFFAVIASLCAQVEETKI